MSTQVEPINLESIKSKNIQTLPLVIHKEEKQNGENIDPLFLAYMMIFEAVKICHDTASIQAKTTQSLALAQNNLINMEGQLNFYQIHNSQLYNKKVVNQYTYGVMPGPWGPVRYKKVVGHVNKYTPAKVGQTVLENVNTKNQRIEALRDQISNKLTVLQQDSSMTETNVNSIMNEDQQDISQGASLMQMLVSLSNQISQI